MPENGFELKHFLHPWPIPRVTASRDLLIRVLSWSLFNEKGAGELSAGHTRIYNRANKNNSRKGERIQGGVEAEANLEGRLYPERPCMSGFFLMTSSWMGSWTALPVRDFPHDLIMGGISHNGSRQIWKKDNAKECSNEHRIVLISRASKVMLKILQARLQQYVNCELPGVQAGFRKGRGTRDQISNICWIIKKAREFQKNIYVYFIGRNKQPFFVRGPCH